MAITSYISLLPYMVPRLPGASKVLIRQALQLKTRDFCYETEALFDRNVKFDLVADQTVYAMTPSSASYEIIRPEEVRIATAASQTAGSYGELADNRSYNYRPDTANLEFVVAPASAALTDGLEVDFIVAPLEDNTAIVANFLARWSRYIQAGALHYLQSQEKRPWTDMTQAAQNSLEYWRGVAIARRDKYTNTSSRQSRMAPPSWI